jgi:hypothetical protein
VTLTPLGDRVRLAATRDSWHALAEHVLANACFRADGRIGLVVSDDGFRTPVLPPDTTASVAGPTLVVTRGGTTTTVPITTLRAAAAALGIEPGAPAHVFTPTTLLEPDAPLPIDNGAAGALSAWFRLGATLLGELAESAGLDDAPSTPTLWPEHFDVGLDLGDESRGGRGTFGASPGDAEHPEPYAYVTHWTDVPDDPFWNDLAFGGASRSYSELAAAPDATVALREFFARGRALLTLAES